MLFARDAQAIVTMTVRGYFPNLLMDFQLDNNLDAFP